MKNNKGLAILLITVLALSTSASLYKAAATVVFQDDFESGSLNAWTTHQGDIVVNSNPSYVYSGSYSAKANGSVAAASVIESITSLSDVYERVYVLFTALVSQGEAAAVASIYAEDWSSSVSAGIQTDSQGGYAWYLYSSTWRSAPATIVTDRWYCVEIERAVGTGTGASRLWVRW